MNRDKPVITVVDGQGGGIGAMMIKKLRQCIPEAEIVALGTNERAAEVMFSAGASSFDSREAAFMELATKVGIIVGVIGILVAGGITGEITPSIAKAIGESPAVKILVPMNKCGIRVAGEITTLSRHIEIAAAMVEQEYNNKYK